MLDREPTKQTRSDPEHLIVGQVVAPFGVKGELKVNVLTEFPERFRKLKEIVLAPFGSIEPGLAPRAALNPVSVRRPRASSASSPTPGPIPVFKPPASPTSFSVEKVRGHKDQAILKLEGIDDADTAGTLRGYWLVVPLEKASRLPKDAYYLYQIVGLEVYTAEGTHLGKVEDVLTTSANDVYVVRGAGTGEPSGELLIPAIKSVVKEIALEQGRIVIAPLEEWA